MAEINEAETVKWLEPGMVWAIKKGLTYGVAAVATALGMKEGLDLTWVIPASAALGALASAAATKLLKWLWSRKQAKIAEPKP